MDRAAQELIGGRDRPAWRVAEARSQISDQILGAAPKTPFLEADGRLFPVGERISRPPKLLRRGEAGIGGSQKLKNEVDREATEAQAFDEGRDGIA